MSYRLLSGLCALVFALGFISCDNKTLNTANAINAIAEYMEKQPIYESATLQVGEINLKVTKDESLIKEYKTLEKEGYIYFSDEITKKRWLSKDSTWTATIKLTDKSHPYVLDQKSNKIKVKTIEYKVNKDSGIQLDNKNAKSANASVMLAKEVTPFVFLKPDSSPHTEFISRKFRLKYTDEAGWIVTK